jgi:hypothetical protein
VASASACTSAITTLHAQARGDAAGLQAKARGGTGDDGNAALQMGHGFSCGV